jgi:hypothetical protein
MATAHIYVTAYLYLFFPIHSVCTDCKAGDPDILSVNKCCGSAKCPSACDCATTKGTSCWKQLNALYLDNNCPTAGSSGAGTSVTYSVSYLSSTFRCTYLTATNGANGITASDIYTQSKAYAGQDCAKVANCLGNFLGKADGSCDPSMIEIVC